MTSNYFKRTKNIKGNSTYKYQETYLKQKLLFLTKFSQHVSDIQSSYI